MKLTNIIASSSVLLCALFAVVYYSEFGINYHIQWDIHSGDERKVKTFFGIVYKITDPPRKTYISKLLTLELQQEGARWVSVWQGNPKSIVTPHSGTIPIRNLLRQHHDDLEWLPYVRAETAEEIMQTYSKLILNEVSSGERAPVILTLQQETWDEFSDFLYFNWKSVEKITPAKLESIWNKKKQRFQSQ